MSKKDSSDAGQDEIEQGSNPAPEIEDAEIIEHTKPEPQASEKPSGGGKTALVLAIIALLGTAGGLGYGYLQLQAQQETLQSLDQALTQANQQRDGLGSQLKATQNAFEQQKQQLADQRQALQAQEAKLAEERQRLDRQSAEMKQTLESVYQRVGRNSTAWMAAEAEYLLRVANHRLALARDVGTAIEALEAADGRLRDTGDPGWQGVRELIADEVATLKAVGTVDRGGLSAKLVSLVKQSKSLKMVGLEYSPAEPMPAKQDETREKSLKTMLDDGWKGFKSLMVVRHRDKPVAAMLSPKQQFFVYQNLELQLEAARMALLRGDAALYESSLQQTEQWVAKLFDEEANATKAMLRALRELRGVEIRPELPDISGSLLALTERRKAAEGEGGRQ